MNREDMKERLIKWVDSLKSNYYHDPEMYLYECEEYIKVILFTENNKYIIKACSPTERWEGYLGCRMNWRRPMAGEDWTRGHDLTDGAFCHGTWVRILGEIVGCELVRIHRPIKESYDKE